MGQRSQAGMGHVNGMFEGMPGYVTNDSTGML